MLALTSQESGDSDEDVIQKAGVPAEIQTVHFPHVLHLECQT
jgi:hypothetical protein